jgi:hypothetical protein
VKKWLIAIRKTSALVPIENLYQPSMVASPSAKRGGLPLVFAIVSLLACSANAAADVCEADASGECSAYRFLLDDSSEDARRQTTGDQVRVVFKYKKCMPTTSSAHPYAFLLKRPQLCFVCVSCLSSRFFPRRRGHRNRR